MGNPHPKPGGAAGLPRAMMAANQVLTPYLKEPKDASTPAKSMSDQLAYDVFMHMVSQGQIKLHQSIKASTDGKIISPKPGEQVDVKTRLAGVIFKNEQNAALASFQPKPALAIALHRMASSLANGKYGVTEIVWGGIGFGHKGKKLNCHMVGTCIDIYSVQTRLGKIDVFKDWGIRPVFLANGNKVAANEVDPWADATKTYYRLRSKDNQTTYEFFKDLYQLATEQFTTDASDTPALEEAKPVKLGGNIFHPDYPGITLRREHQEHVHFQIGPSYL